MAISGSECKIEISCINVSHIFDQLVNLHQAMPFLVGEPSCANVYLITKNNSSGVTYEKKEQNVG